MPSRFCTIMRVDVHACVHVRADEQDYMFTFHVGPSPAKGKFVFCARTACRHVLCENLTSWGVHALLTITAPSDMLVLEHAMCCLVCEICRYLNLCKCPCGLVLYVCIGNESNRGQGRFVYMFTYTCVSRHVPVYVYVRVWCEQ